MERRLGIMQSVEPVLENAIKTLQKVVDVRGMGKKWEASSFDKWNKNVHLNNKFLYEKIKVVASRGNDSYLRL